MVPWDEADLVEKLRRISKPVDDNPVLRSLQQRVEHEAANEIERLQDRVRDLERELAYARHCGA
jgi:hypothetical protein